MSDLTREMLPTPELRRPLVPVELPAWPAADGTPGKLYVRRLSAVDALTLPEPIAEWTGLLVLRSACFADGSRLWQDADLPIVLAYPQEDLQPLVDAAVAVNGYDKSVEDRKGN